MLPLKPVPPFSLHPDKRSPTAKKLTAILTPEAPLCMLNEVATGGSLLDRQAESEFVQNYKQLQSAVRGYFVNRGFTVEDADDMTQETFLLAFRGMGRFRQDAEFKTWLFQIAANVLKKTLRGSTALKRGGPGPAPGSMPSDEIPGYASPLEATESDTRSRQEGQQLENLLTDEFLGLTRQAVEEMPAKMQRCFLLYVHQERKYHEIAALMNLSINTVKSHIHQARKRLKETVGDPHDGLGR